MKRTISMLRDHVVLCGYGRFGRVVAEELSRLGVGLVVIETNPAMQPALEASGHPFVIGSALDDPVLAEAGIARRRSWCSLARTTCSSLPRAIQPGPDPRGESARSPPRSQAPRAFSPYLGGQRIAVPSRPSVVDFITLARLRAPEISLERWWERRSLEAGLLRPSARPSATWWRSNAGEPRFSPRRTLRRRSRRRWAVLRAAPDRPLAAG
jgi:hypothetical protein